MNIIKTTFGEIYLDSPRIRFKIQDSSIGAIREVEFEGIADQSSQQQARCLLSLSGLTDSN